LLAHVLRDEKINVYKRSDLLKQVEPEAKKKKCDRFSDVTCMAE
jgi:hypothetical protein